MLANRTWQVAAMLLLGFRTGGVDTIFVRNATKAVAPAKNGRTTTTRNCQEIITTIEVEREQVDAAYTYFMMKHFIRGDEWLAYQIEYWRYKEFLGYVGDFCVHAWGKDDDMSQSECDMQMEFHPQVRFTVELRESMAHSRVIIRGEASTIIDKTFTNTETDKKLTYVGHLVSGHSSRGNPTKLASLELDGWTVKQLDDVCVPGPTSVSTTATFIPITTTTAWNCEEMKTKLEIEHPENTGYPFVMLRIELNSKSDDKTYYAIEKVMQDSWSMFCLAVWDKRQQKFNNECKEPGHGRYLPLTVEIWESADHSRLILKEGGITLINVTSINQEGAIKSTYVGSLMGTNGGKGNPEKLQSLEWEGWVVKQLDDMCVRSSNTALSTTTTRTTSTLAATVTTTATTCVETITTLEIDSDAVPAVGTSFALMFGAYYGTEEIRPVADVEGYNDGTHIHIHMASGATIESREVKNITLYHAAPVWGIKTVLEIRVNAAHRRFRLIDEAGYTFADVNFSNPDATIWSPILSHFYVDSEKVDPAVKVPGQLQQLTNKGWLVEQLGYECVLSTTTTTSTSATTVSTTTTSSIVSTTTTLSTATTMTTTSTSATTVSTTTTRSTTTSSTSATTMSTTSTSSTTTTTSSTATTTTTLSTTTTSATTVSTTSTSSTTTTTSTSSTTTTPTTVSATTTLSTIITTTTYSTTTSTTTKLSTAASSVSSTTTLSTATSTTTKSITTATSSMTTTTTKGTTSTTLPITTATATIRTTTTSSSRTGAMTGSVASMNSSTGGNFSMCTIWGDPHVHGMHNNYDFMQPGIFEYLKSEAAGIRVQAYQCYWKGKTTFSTVVATAAQVGAHRITLNGMQVQVNDTVLGDGKHTLFGGVEVDKFAGHIHVRGPAAADGQSELIVRIFSDTNFESGYMMNIQAALPVVHVPHATGLCVNKPAASERLVAQGEYIFSPGTIQKLAAGCSVKQSHNHQNFMNTSWKNACETCSPPVSVSSAEAECATLLSTSFYEGCVFDYCHTCGLEGVVQAAIDAAMIDQTKKEDKDITSEPLWKDNKLNTANITWGENDSYRNTVSMAGDPHCLNVKGEKFEIRSVGSMNLIQIPRNASTDSVAFMVTAEIKPLFSRPCAPTFATSVKVNGSMLNSSVTVRVGKDTTPQMTWGSTEDKLDAGENSSSISVWTSKSHKLKHVVKIKVGAITVTLRQRKLHGAPKYLDLQIDGLKDKVVGGILGVDRNTTTTALRPDCAVQSILAAS